MPEMPFIGAVFFGDSLSDERRKYNENFCCCIPFKCCLHHSDYDNFTDGHTYAFIVENIIRSLSRVKSTWLCSENIAYFKNMAEGGATAYNYRNIASFFKSFKGFILSFFLGNIQNQAKTVKKDKNILHPNKIGIIFAGANDLVTLGYDNAEGIERAIQGIIKTIKILMDRNEKTGFNYLKSLLFINLPDISETPRFKNKPPEEKLKMKLACKRYNQKLQELANEYQYINFDCCTIYKFTNINCLDVNLIKKIKTGLVVIGEGKTKTILFVNKGKFLTKPNKELKKVNIILSKKQQEIFSKKDGEIIRDEKNGNKLDELVGLVTKRVKLNMDIKMLDIQSLFDKICQNPEAYGFTSGCAVYYLSKKENQEADQTLISKNVSTGNAVILKETKNGLFAYLIRDGVLIEEQQNPVKVKVELSVINQIRLRKKIKLYFSEKKLIKLVGMEDIHDICIINIIQSVVKRYEMKFHRKIMLTKVYDSVLEEIKQKYLNRNTIFWDDLHPARRVHDILASEITKFLKSNYLINNQSDFIDDSAIGVRSKLPESLYAEAPGYLPSEPALLTPKP